MANNIYIQNVCGCQITVVLGASAARSGVSRKPLRTCALLITVVAGLLKIALMLVGQA